VRVRVLVSPLVRVRVRVRRLAPAVAGWIAENTLMRWDLLFV
jgi:hypothetical protein